MTQPFSYAYYREMLKCAQDKGYSITSFPAYDPAKPRTIIMRHDVDYTVNGVLELATIEHEMGVSASYLFRVHAHEYNIFTPHVYVLIQHLRGLGHDIGLHLEASAIGRALGQPAAEILRKEKALLELVFDASVVTASEHRDISHDIHHTQPFRLSHDVYAFGFRYYAMADAYIKQMKYLSDSNGFWREGDLIQHLEKHERFQVLIHPDWWFERDLLLKGAYVHGFGNGRD